MAWHVQYRRDGIEHLAEHRNPEQAIETACLLIDEGVDVYSIGTGLRDESITGDEITRIHRFWARPRNPFQ
jgi:hypothetical protein